MLLSDENWYSFCRRLDPARLLGRRSRAVCCRSRGLHANERERRKRRNPADGAEKDGSGDQCSCESAQLVGSARGVFREIDLAAGQHAVVGIP